MFLCPVLAQQQGQGVAEDPVITWMYSSAGLGLQGLWEEGTMGGF